MLDANDVYGAVGEFSRTYLYKHTMDMSNLKNDSDVMNLYNNISDIDLYDTKGIFPDSKTNKSQQRWAGQFFYVATTDNSTREGTLEFYDDESQKIYKLFKELKKYTGDESKAHSNKGSGVNKFNMEIFQISVDKNTIIQARQLKGISVYGVSKTEPDKGSEDLGKVTVDIAWDDSQDDDDMIGNTLG